MMHECSVSGIWFPLKDPIDQVSETEHDQTLDSSAAFVTNAWQIASRKPGTKLE